MAAIDCLQKIIEMDPLNVDAYIRLANIYIEQTKEYGSNRDISSAIEVLDNGYKKTQDGKLLDVLNAYIVQFEDSQLEEMVRENVGKSSGYIYISDVFDIENLKFCGNGIEDPEKSGWYYFDATSRDENGVYYWDDHKYYIEEGELLDMLRNCPYPADGELAELYSYLELSRIVVSAYSAIYYDGDICTLTGIQNFSSLRNLKISQNRISDIGALSSLTNLTSLDLSNNNISDISVLSRHYLKVQQLLTKVEKQSILET